MARVGRKPLPRLLILPTVYCRSLILNKFVYGCGQQFTNLDSIWSGLHVCGLVGECMTGCVCALCLSEQDRDGILECVYTRMSLPGLQWHLSSEWMEVQCCAWVGWRGKSGCQQALRLCWGSAAPWKYLLYQRKLSKHIFCPWLKALQAWFCLTQNHHFELFFLQCVIMDKVAICIAKLQGKHIKRSTEKKRFLY